MQANAPILELKHASVWRGDTLALNKVSVTIPRGENVAILGPNGSGKSTLLKLITGELHPYADPRTVCRLFGDDLWSLEELRHHIGIVMPEEVTRFDEEDVAFEVVLSALRGAYGRTREMRFSAREKAATTKAIRQVGLTPLAENLFSDLSSGERRRFLIARALVHQPEVLVLDEPSTALDFGAAAKLLTTMRTLLRGGRTLVLVTHHPNEIPPEIERVILLKKGRVIADDAKRRVLTSAVLSDCFGVPLRARHQDGWCHVTPA